MSLFHKHDRRTDRRTDGQTDRPTTRLLELLRAAKNAASILVSYQFWFLINFGLLSKWLPRLTSYAGEHGVRVLQGGCCHRPGVEENGYPCDDPELDRICRIAVQV